MLMTGYCEVAMPHDTLLKRIRAEYLEMPGLALTLEQARRLCGVERTLCQQVLDLLGRQEVSVLCAKPDMGPLGDLRSASDGT
jgi:hypothetical protein